MASTARALWTENEEAVTRDVRGFLFIRDDREWLIAGQAWDYTCNEEPRFDELLAWTL
jgi:hypothetical protein